MIVVAVQVMIFILVMLIHLVVLSVLVPALKCIVPIVARFVRT
jgi:hypothetical protein